MSIQSSNIHPTFENLISRAQKESFLNQKGVVLWFTGLSGSGKSTIAQALEKELFRRGFHVQTLDGDNVRTGLCSNLTFTLEDRSENIRRVAEVANLFMKSGIICLCTFVSPTRSIRKMAYDIVGENDFLEIFIDTPLEVCEKRDVKGLYKKARKGKIKNFTGIDSPFEAPQHPFTTIKTEQRKISDCVHEIITALKL